ncbi:deleted in malignant brain tumors 1 protein-like isoform X2 [Haplochromis burtoni]|uniref:deleted in malignant brain tumors 1 protein-like isoform X2 n=1 Tax=Haplochromis burtoni TaxID=8153 RepID=UPI001C2D4ADC|nr:deleted in malignant brain tumors 1 protein-like isoform X2 [Haplochromis burtoni]
MKQQPFFSVMEGREKRALHFLILVAYLVVSPSPSAGQIRLVGSRCSGRVEIYNSYSYSYSYGRVCDNGWDLKDAEVACRELNCGIALQAGRYAYFGQGTGNFFRSNVDCSGSEISLDYCRYISSISYSCNFGRDAEVVCSDTLPEPTISLYSNEVTWGQDVSITCSVSYKFSGGTFILQKTSGSFSQSQTSSMSSVTFNLHNVNFDHDGLYECQYMKTSRRFSSSPVRLSVTVRLQTPSISLTSPGAGLVWGPEGAEITRGYSFVLTCSINSTFSSGRFFLIFSDSNITDSEPAVNNSASFSFPVAEYEHQGNYSCVYEVTVSTRTFSSTATAPITVIIKFPRMLLVSSVVPVVLLLLLVLLVVLLVLRRRRQTQQAHIHTTVTLKTCNEEDDVSDEERIYMNVETLNTYRNFTKQTGRAKREETYEKERKVEADEEQSSGDENDHVYVTQMFAEQTVDLYEEQEDIYQNI